MRRTWPAACLLAAACGESNSPPEPTGQIRVTSSTTGASVDPDGYTVAVDGGVGQPIQVDGTLLIDEVAPGDHSLTLSGVANNCHIGEPQPVAVLVSAGDTADASFTFTCEEVGRLAFAYRAPGEPVQDIYVINADGSGPTRLTHMALARLGGPRTG